MWAPTNSGNRSESCSKNCDFRIARVVRCHSESGISHSENHFLNSESCSENTPELSESSENGLFTGPTPKPPTVRKSHEQDPLSSRDPLPLTKKVQEGGSRPEGGGPGSKGGRGPGSWCCSACTGSRSVGMPRAGYPQRARTPRISLEIEIFMRNWFV